MPESIGNGGIIRNVKLVRHFQQERPHLSPGGAERGVCLCTRAFPVSLTTPNLAPAESWREKFGTIKGCPTRSGWALYGDLHYNRAHPMADQILEAAEIFARPAGYEP